MVKFLDFGNPKRGKCPPCPPLIQALLSSLCPAARTESRFSLVNVDGMAENLSCTLYLCTKSLKNEKCLFIYDVIESPYF